MELPYLIIYVMLERDFGVSAGANKYFLLHKTKCAYQRRTVLHVRNINSTGKIFGGVVEAKMANKNEVTWIAGKQFYVSNGP